MSACAPYLRPAAAVGAMLGAAPQRAWHEASKEKGPRVLAVADSPLAASTLAGKPGSTFGRLISPGSTLEKL